ncbi:MAG: phosphatase PAP2 family protein [Proteobacteria bacterium]|nr:phosphatase PAP2 family protein [Pseudomonadota bacterium]MBI3495806.1 phosphatase PAP2 family protein [Pseudomonadota bacterium]
MDQPQTLRSGALETASLRWFWPVALRDGAEHARAFRLFLALTAVTAAIILSAMLALDRPLALLLREHAGPVVPVFQWITRLGEARWYLFPSGVVGLAALWIRRTRTDEAIRERWRQRLLQAGYIFAAVAGTGLAADVVKIAVGRARPKLLFAADFHGFHPLATTADLWSFPSGHATTAGALAMALYVLWPRPWPVYLVFALAVTASRVVITQHYLSDALAGLYLGALGAVVLGWAAARRGYRLRPEAPSPSAIRSSSAPL